MDGIISNLKKIFIYLNFRKNETTTLTQKFDLASSKLDTLEFVEKYGFRKAEPVQLKESIPSLTFKKVERHEARLVKKEILPPLPITDETIENLEEKEKLHEV